MSSHKEKQEIIYETMPKLIEILTGFESTDPNFQLCEQFAFNIIKNHRNLSANSHEIQRKIDAMAEKFLYGNYENHADNLRKYCTILINHPVCLSHYETDIQWSILDFLLTLSYNPVASLKQKKGKLPEIVAETYVDETESEQNYWAQILKEDCFDLEQSVENGGNDSESDLSEWSECSGSDEASKEISFSLSEILNTEKHELNSEQEYCKLIKKFQGFKPPERSPHSVTFNSINSKQWLDDNIQNSWWNDEEFQCATESSFNSATFGLQWHQYVIEKTFKFQRRQISVKISTISEYCLLREIIWMFQIPVNCKMFGVKEEDEIFVKENVTVPSLTTDGVKILLDSIIPYMKMMKKLKKFIKSTYKNCDNEKVPHTFECYTNSLQKLLEPFEIAILEQENEIKEQAPAKIHTVVQFKQRLHKHFVYLQCLYDIHTEAVLDYKENKAHICSAHLIASLMSTVRSTTCQLTASLAATLAVTSLKLFCEIIDCWWTGGRLDDWRSEFLVEKISNEQNCETNGAKIIARLYEKSKEKTFFVSGNVSRKITDDSLLKVIMLHSLEAGATLSLLYEIDKMRELEGACDNKNCFYMEFLNSFCQRIEDFQSFSNENSVENVHEKPILENTPSDFRYSNIISLEDELIMKAMGFNTSLISSLPIEENNKKSDRDDCHKSLKIFEQINNTSNLILPLEDIIIKSITKLLDARILFVNQFVVKMYREKYGILRHLQNIRKILLLEASDIMQIFYVKLFNQIESGKSWANPFFLTVQLDDTITSKYPFMSSLFQIEINSAFKCETTKVVDAVDELFIHYNIQRELRNIITLESINEYNKVFRLLLKIKWSLWSLENLRFQRYHRRPYAHLRLIDLMMRRLEQLRFWLIYALQCVQFHLMTHVLHTMGEKLDQKIEQCKTLSEMKSVHDSFVNTICEHCFQNRNSSDLKVGVEQLFNLVYVISFEWRSCCRTMARGITNECDDDDQTDSPSTNYLETSQIEALEKTYITCHQYMVDVLTSEVYKKENTYLSGLSAGFISSIPY